ncbi:MAG: hypothetical protein R3F43_02905 [bacterium]
MASGALALAEALGQLTSEPVVIVGNSLGCLAAIRVTLARPELVAGLFLRRRGAHGSGRAGAHDGHLPACHPRGRAGLHRSHAAARPRPAPRGRGRHPRSGGAARPAARRAAGPDGRSADAGRAARARGARRGAVGRARATAAGPRPRLLRGPPARRQCSRRPGPGPRPQHQDLRFTVAEACAFLERVAAA